MPIPSLYIRIRSGQLKVNNCSPAIHRFWKGVEKTESCWLWTLAVSHNNYGVLSVNDKTIRVHRYSYELHKGVIPDKLCVCHRCDVRNCVNPDHLFLGTYADNYRDMIAKDRQANYLLTEEDVKEIRRRYLLWKKNPTYRSKNGRTAIARDYGVSKSTISDILSKRTWTKIS